MSFVINLDHNATTPTLPEVLEAMMPYLTTERGNVGPNSVRPWDVQLANVSGGFRATCPLVS
jgi:selenocysteine lyase/cysteine desulfurase